MCGSPFISLHWKPPPQRENRTLSGGRMAGGSPVAGALLQIREQAGLTQLMGSGLTCSCTEHVCLMQD